MSIRIKVDKSCYDSGIRAPLRKAAKILETKNLSKYAIATMFSCGGGHQTFDKAVAAIYGLPMTMLGLSKKEKKILEHAFEVSRDTFIAELARKAAKSSHAAKSLDSVADYYKLDSNSLNKIGKRKGFTVKIRAK